MKKIDELTEREILALAISLGEDERVYADFEEGLRQDFSASAAVFEGMRVVRSYPLDATWIAIRRLGPLPTFTRATSRRVRVSMIEQSSLPLLLTAT